MANPKVVSDSAIARVLAIQAHALKAAYLMHRMVRADDGYTDFFVEGPDGGSWHEGFDESPERDGNGNGETRRFGVSRMVALQAMGLTADGYADFFVEGPDDFSWHQAVFCEGPDYAEKLGQLINSVSARANALSKLTVLQAYAMLKAGAFAKP